MSEEQTITMLCMLCGEVFYTNFVTYLCPECHGKLAESLKLINDSSMETKIEEVK